MMRDEGEPSFVTTVKRMMLARSSARAGRSRRTCRRVRVSELESCDARTTHRSSSLPGLLLLHNHRLVLLLDPHDLCNLSRRRRSSSSLRGRSSRHRLALLPPILHPPALHLLPRCHRMFQSLLPLTSLAADRLPPWRMLVPHHVLRSRLLRRDRLRTDQRVPLQSLPRFESLQLLVVLVLVPVRISVLCIHARSGDLAGAVAVG